MVPGGDAEHAQPEQRQAHRQRRPGHAGEQRSQAGDVHQPETQSDILQLASHPCATRHSVLRGYRGGGSTAAVEIILVRECHRSVTTTSCDDEIGSLVAASRWSLVGWWRPWPVVAATPPKTRPWPRPAATSDQRPATNDQQPATSIAPPTSL